MAVFSKSLEIVARQRGLFEITGDVAGYVAKAGIKEGLCHVFVQHTSASLTLMENADPSAREDLERYMDQLAPEAMPFFTHVLEGADDMPSHIKTVLTTTSLTLPIRQGRLALGTWQGLFLWEHREGPHRRKILMTVLA